MLSDSYQSFIESPLFLGGPAYGIHSSKIKPWYQYLYIAQFDGRYDKVKIGITSSILRRNDELNRENEGANIRYVWNMPTNLEIESKVKILLSNFTRKFSTKKLRTETFYIPITPFILFVRLVILYIYLEGGYIPANDAVKKKLQNYLERARIEYIKHNGAYYRQQNNSPRMKAILRTQKLVNDVLDIQRRTKKQGDKYIFSDVKDFYYIPDVVDQMRTLTKSKGNNPFGYKQIGEFIDEWIETYVTDGEINNELMKFLPKEGQNRAEFKEGDMVTVTYPPYRPADKKPSKEGGRSKLGDENYPDGGSWQGRIIKMNKNKYRIKWAFGEFKDSETDVPIDFIHHDGDVKRGVDVTKIYKDLKLPSTIDYGEYDEFDKIPEEVKAIADAMIDLSQYKLKI